MKKLVYFSTVAAPHQIKFVPYLQKYFDTHFFFYEQPSGRNSFWRIPLGERCKILPCLFKWRCKYISFAPFRYLRDLKPDIVMLGGMSVPTNYLIYLWARWHKCKTVIQTERSRDKNGRLRKFGVVWRVLRFLYKDIDCIACVSEDTVAQYRDTFHFGDRVIVLQYPCDIDRYFMHPIRGKKEFYTLIMANRMTDIYDPLMGIDIFNEVLKRHPKTRLKINAAGELRPQVEARIAQYDIGGLVEFLDNLKSWDDLDDVYRTSDIMYLPAKWSNGNNTIAETMSSGMAVVISDRVLGWWCEQFRRQGGGFVCRHDVSAFVDTICWIIEHPECFKDIATINRQDQRRWTMAAKAIMYRDAFEKLFNKGTKQNG